ncbi:hypothetical protein ABEG70_01010 [Pantoea agglomerans]
MEINKITELPKDAPTLLKGGSEKMSSKPLDELVIGLVCSVGTNLDVITTKIKERLSLFKFRSHEIKVSSDIIAALTGQTNYSNDYQRIEGLMSKGNELRQQSE